MVSDPWELLLAENVVMAAGTGILSPGGSAGMTASDYCGARKEQHTERRPRASDHSALNLMAACCCKHIIPAVFAFQVESASAVRTALFITLRFSLFAE